MDDRRSDRFGRYEILTELGRGAMGVVYKARDPKINRVVAVKTVSLAGQSADDELDYRERFFREAEAAGRLSHPGIVTIFDVGEEPETRAPYIVMEFVGGQSLDKLLSRGDHKLPVEVALQLALELAEALDCAHGQGVVHRDLKPANILLTEDGHAKIADFGVAKLNLANHTLAGRALGTPAYMSPEQLNGDTVDGRSDLFSLGVVLYTVLTGYRPFQGNSALTVSFKVVNREPVPATVLETELPQGLDYIIARAMAKDPAERYQRGMEMVLDIQELREGREPWSKAKLPGSPAAGHAANERAKPSLGQPWIAAKLLSSARSAPFGHAGAEGLLGKMPTGSFAFRLAFAALLVLGFGFGLWVIAFGPPGLTSRVASNSIDIRQPAESMPIADAPVKTAPDTPAEPAESAVASVATPPAPLELRKPVPADRTYPSPARLARARTPKASPATSAAAAPATSPAISPATSPATSLATSSATLGIQVDHKFTEAHLSIWVDDRLTYTHLLEGSSKKHLVVFHHVEGHEFHAMQVPAGNHRLRVEVASDGVISDQSGTVAGEFTSGRENVLRINFDKNGAMSLSLQ
jgi:tRNA A-37 threonylcarbamoyl transferase component Bud32